MRTHSFHPLWLVVVGFLCFFVVAPIGVKGKGKPAVPPPPVDARKLIESINAADSAISIKNMRDNTVRSYKVDDVTVVNVNDSPGKISDIKVGMLVVDSVERDANMLDGISVRQGDTPKPAAGKKKTKNLSANNPAS